jgi:hypothetical protein
MSQSKLENRFDNLLKQLSLNPIHDQEGGKGQKNKQNGHSIHHTTSPSAASSSPAISLTDSISKKFTPFVPFPSDVKVEYRAPTQEEVDRYLHLAKILWEDDRKHLFLTIDLEFKHNWVTKRNDFALLQLCFDQGEIGTDKRSRTVYLTNTGFPGLEILLTDSNVKKIVHGSESNDVPWLLQQIGNAFGEQEKPALFLHFVDTCFVAQYINASQRSGLYDALVNYGVLTEATKERLLELEKSMGKIQYVNWELEKIKPAVVEYAIHDVLYLRDLYVALRNKEPTFSAFRNLLRLCFMERFFKILQKEQVDKMNGYFTIPNKRSLIEQFDHHLPLVHIPSIDLHRVLKVGWIKQPTLTFLRRIFYGIMTRKYQLYISKNQIIPESDLGSIIPTGQLKDPWASLQLIIKEITHAWEKQLEL